jgi:hypothetical protein
LHGGKKREKYGGDGTWIFVFLWYKNEVMRILIFAAFVFLVGCSDQPQYEQRDIYLQSSLMAAKYAEPYLSGYHASGLVPVRELGGDAYEVNGMAMNGMNVGANWKAHVHWRGGNLYSPEKWELTELYVNDKKVK